MYSLDCTLRDGGYYNKWNFSSSLIEQYLQAMQSCGVNAVEMGLRSLINSEFRGACFYTTDSFLRTLNIPSNLDVGVMVNASELVGNAPMEKVLESLFPVACSDSPVDLVRVACHVHEFSKALPAAQWLKNRGYTVGFNLMQIAERDQEEVEALSSEASKYPLDVLYFADSMGSMNPEHTAQIIRWLQHGWSGPMGIHTHDNMGLALQNTLRAMDEGVTWVDSTVTGMGRGPGNARTEEVVIEVADRREESANIVPLMRLIREHFKPMQNIYGWGTNPFYFLSGKYGIHPSYIQEMMGDSRYSEEDIIAAIEHLRVEGGKKFSLGTLDAAKQFFKGEVKGQWRPSDLMADRHVLLLGSGPGVREHRDAIEQYIRQHQPVVMALNTQSGVAEDLVDVRVACHPVRLLADCDAHCRTPTPLITPASMLPDDVTESLRGKDLLDFGLAVEPERFAFEESFCSVPSSLVMAYALAIIASGKSRGVLMAGFDGYGADDPRNEELVRILDLYQATEGSVELVAITPTRYPVKSRSVYGC